MFEISNSGTIGQKFGHPFQKKCSDFPKTKRIEAYSWNLAIWDTWNLIPGLYPWASCMQGMPAKLRNDLPLFSSAKKFHGCFGFFCSTTLKSEFSKKLQKGTPSNF